METKQSPLPGPAVQSLHVFVLTALACSVRLYALLGNRPMFFAIRQSRAIDLLAFVVTWSVLLPGLLVAAEWLAGRAGPRVRDALHMALVAALLTAIALPLCKQADRLPGEAMVAGAVALAILAAVAYRRFHAVAALVTILCPLVVLSPAIFLLESPASKFLLRWSAPTPLDVEVENPVPVVMLVFDEFSGISLMDARHRIDPVRCPGFAALAADSTWFRNATSMYSETESALPAILTGGRPKPGIKEPDAFEYPMSLFTLLAGSHAMKVDEPITTLCPPEWCDRTAAPVPLGLRWSSCLTDAMVLELILLLPPDWPVRLPDVSGKWGFFLGQQPAGVNPMFHRREQVERFIASIEPSEEPALYFMHVLLPHIPWAYLPSGKEYSLLPLGPREEGHPLVGHDDILGMDRQTHVWAADELAVAQGRQRYLLQVGCVDRLVDRLVRRLKEVGLYDRSLVVITADHGVALLPGQPMRAINEATGPQLMSVPLLIKLPHQHRGVVSDRNVESIDILPTMAAALEIRLPWTPEGASALDASLPERTVKVIAAGPSHPDRWSCGAKFEEKYTALGQLLEGFGSDAASPGLFRIGPHSELVGRPLAQCRVARDVAGCVELAGAAHLAHVRPDDGWLPCYLGGRVTSPTPTPLPMDLAVAVNGTIRAVTRTFHLPGLEDAWAAIVPEEVFRQGANDVQVFAVSGRGENTTLHPLTKQ